LANSVVFEDDKEKALYQKIEQARNRYDWAAYYKLMEEICKYNLDKRGYNMIDIVVDQK